jgi:signal transduction histidine kinase
LVRVLAEVSVEATARSHDDYVRRVLHEFLIANRREILARSREKLAAREVPVPTESELADGLPLFLDQLIAILRTGKGERSGGQHRVVASAAHHGGALQRLGLTVGQVVQDYGSICQSVTELADERDVAITADEFHTFNGCLDDATARAVTEYEHRRDKVVADSSTAHLDFLAHEMRNLLTTSMLTFDALRRGSVGIQGSTGTLLARNLRRMRALMDRTLTEVRLGSGAPRPERVSVAELIEEIEIVATIDAQDHDVQLAIDAGPSQLSVEADHQILASAVANLLQNAFKFTRGHGHVAVRVRTIGERVLIDVEDGCGGLAPDRFEELSRQLDQREGGEAESGLGLSISLKGIRASGGEIRIRDLPGSGCVFTVDLPRAPAIHPPRTPIGSRPEVIPHDA